MIKPKVIIFDFDGTLCDTRHNIIVAFRATMERLGLELRDEATCGATIGLTLRDGFRSMYPELSNAAIDYCVDTYRQIFAERREELMPELFPYVADTLEELHRRGYRFTVASSRLTDSLMLFMRHHGIDTYFEYVVGSDSVENHKPHPEPVLKTLAALNIEPTDAFVVGDMPVDIAMAHGAGVEACVVTYGNATREELEASGAEIVIDRFDKLLDILE
ncbi:MAG: HAD-IA family hydrolase [Alistipes sp.]|nr:HAD-IA family hydrolase [Alistipes sp.]